MNFEQVARLLKKQVGNNPAAWAKKYGISSAYVDGVIHGTRIPGDKITRAMGLEKALLWRVPGHRALLHRIKGEK